MRRISSTSQRQPHSCRVKRSQISTPNSVGATVSVGWRAEWRRPTPPTVNGTESRHLRSVLSSPNRMEAGNARTGREGSLKANYYIFLGTHMRLPAQPSISSPLLYLPLDGRVPSCCIGGSEDSRTPGFETQLDAMRQSRLG